MPLGIAADSTFATMTFQFEVDDVLVAYTDGITETANRDGELWGEGRLESLLRSCGRQTPEQIINSILDEVSAFASGQAQQDDMTLVVMGVQAGCGA
jgi:sigma-B regulation protein RsbU (phosphoserine phosphatase)